MFLGSLSLVLLFDFAFGFDSGFEIGFALDFTLVLTRGFLGFVVDVWPQDLSLLLGFLVGFAPGFSQVLTMVLHFASSFGLPYSWICLLPKVSLIILN